MGSLNISAGCTIAVDTSTVIFAVERHPRFESILQPLWNALEARQIQVVASELVIIESLTGAYASKNRQLLSDYEEFFQNSGIQLLAIDRELLRSAARLRAETRLKTPDAIHAATAKATGCTTFVTRDSDYRRVPGFSITLLDDLVSD